MYLESEACARVDSEMWNDSGVVGLPQVTMVISYLSRYAGQLSTIMQFSVRSDIEYMHSADIVVCR